MINTNNPIMNVSTDTTKYNIKEYEKGDSTQVVRKTPLLEKAYVDKVKSRTEKGLDRSLTMAGGMNHLTLMGLYNASTQRFTEDQITHINLNLMADKQGKVLLMKENVHWIAKNDVSTKNTKFTAEETLQELLHVGFLEKYTHHRYTKGEAREGLVKQKKKLTKLGIEVCSYYLDNSVFDLMQDVQTMFEEKVDDMPIYWPEHPERQEASLYEAQLYFMEQRDTALLKSSLRAYKVVKDIKHRQEKEGITYELIEYIASLLHPGYNRERKFRIIEGLCEKYKVSGKHQTEVEQLSKDEGIVEGKGEDVADVDVYVADVDVYIEMPKCTSIYNHSSPYNPNLNLNPSSNLPLSTPDSLPSPNSLLPLPSTISTLSDLRSYASDLISCSNADVTECYNDALTQGVMSCTSKDSIDDRQKQVMLSNGCLPTEYRLTTPVSPRVYSKEIDNLFYARKEVRLKAMEGLGFMDVDLQNCHAEIVASTWPTHVPILRECLDKGSLWTHYEDYFATKGVPFYKSLIKAMHHATFLSGGRPAYKAAWNRYNQAHTNNPLTEEEFNQVVKVFTSSPLCGELKSLFKHIKSEWVGKVLTVPTGEKFLVKDTNWKVLKKEGRDTGNFPTALAAYLQSIEVSLVSYLIARCHGLFVPILWQHDGLTIKALYPETVPLMEEALKEFCTTYLKTDRVMKLTVERL